RRFAGGKKIFKLPGGEIYIDADMDIDADGSPRARAIDPCAGCGQPSTSLSYLGISGQARFVNAEEVPYIALPGSNRHLRDRFYVQMGLQLGDIAAVINGDKIEFALFADVGPPDKIGEGSIFLSQSLGHDPFITRRNGTRIIGSSIDRDVIYIVFPHSKPSGLAPRNVVETVRERGRELFASIGGHAAP
ncbi:MAG: glycoside hydrolase family 75 protein, partial [Pyrinomonadaceae bacterium]